MKNFEIVEKGSNGVHPIAKCPNCSQKMRTHHLKEHLPKCRGDDRKYFCPSCKKGLHERAVRRHLKSKHSELSNIPICDLWLEAVSKFPGWKFALAKKHAYEEEYHKTEETLEICPECSQKTFSLEQHLKCAHQQPVAIEEKENSESPNIHVQTNMLKIPAFSIGSINSEQEDQKKIESLTLGFESVQLSTSTLEKEEKKKEVEIEEPQIDEINEKINGEKYSNSSRIFEEKGELIPFSRHGHYKLTPSPIFEEKNEIIPDLEDENENYETKNVSMDKQISAKLEGQSHSELIFTPILKDKNEIIQIKRKNISFVNHKRPIRPFGGLDKTPLISLCRLNYDGIFNL